MEALAKGQAEVGQAVARVLDWSQRRISDRIQLLQRESYDCVFAAVRNTSILMIGALCLALAWLLLLAAAVVALKVRWPLETRLAAVAAFQAATGFVLVGWSRTRRARA